MCGLPHEATFAVVGGLKYHVEEEPDVLLWACLLIGIIRLLTM